MNKRIHHILLIVNLHKDDSKGLMDEIQTYLEKKSIQVSICAFEGKPAVLPEGNYDLAFSLGGDGTVLYAARCMAPLGVPLLPINLGTLGFIAAVHRDEWEKVFEAWNSGHCSSSRRLMLDVEVIRNSKSIFRQSCLNDAVIAASGISKLIRLDVHTETVRLGRYSSDGLITATPTGSTAYSVAAGGPILDPEMDALIINPICPFTLSNRPIVVPAHEKILIRVEQEQRSAVQLTIDGQIVEQLLPGDLLSIGCASQKAELIASDRTVFYTVLRSKLNWSGGPDA